MEQMYMIEIFVDKVTVFTNEDSSADKNLIIKIKFGPKSQFIIKEGQLIVSEEKKDDTIEVTESGRKQFSRVIRVGKSFLFPSYPDTIITTLSKFPLEIEVWNDDENEPEDKTFVGVGLMLWHTSFFHYLKETADAFKLHEPLSIKEVTTLYQECCCGKAGEITFILRLSALGDTIITEFQQQMSDPDKFCFRTNKAPSMFECKRIEGDDPNFCMIGSLYETTTLEDPDVMDNAQKKIEVCTELQSCGIAGAGTGNVCEHSETEPEKKHTIEKIRMGDIVGPCGNSNCPLAHKVRAYIRNLASYKTKAGSLPAGEKKTDGTKKICGTCGCKDDRWHREDCPDKAVPDKTKCADCGGLAKMGETCEDKKNKHFKTGATPPENTPPNTPKQNKTQAQYVTSLPNFEDAMFRRDYIIQEYFDTTFNSVEDIAKITGANKSDSVSASAYQSTDRKTPGGPSTRPTPSKSSTFTMGNNNFWVFNNTATYSGCTDIPDDKDCRCNPPKPSPPCNTFDCNCIAETLNKASRKAHRAYCPLYKHKNNCPVTVTDEEELKKEDEEDEAEPLPYGLPPVQLGPCPVMGRPCTVPDGFARMYKTAVQPTHPPSYSDAGKVCCSKEYQRIKKALKEYMQYQKDHDFRCINKFNVDTERRCCDKEQVLKALMGRECCGSHKLAIQEKYKKDEKKPS
ncbi:unnamed protein product [Arctia plantaginis]|uniref:Uncharacterized protein n=1 Tax=Arctia plantaginis TaxID=874455 RepID=A0A8S1AQU4_ARCPL|nr:unnamed protein product [Arctia plantaginis]